MHPRHGLPVLQRSDAEIQIGLDPRWTITLTGLTPDQVSALMQLGSGTDRAYDALAGLDEQLTASLRAAGAILPAPAPTVDPLTRAWGHLVPDADTSGLESARRAATIGILGLGRSGLRIAQCLIACGIGRLILDDDDDVRGDDVGPGAYRIEDLGAKRRDRAAELLTTSSGSGQPATAILPGDAQMRAEDLDAIVVVAHGTVDPARTWRLLGLGIPHLPVVWGEASVEIGPLVLPGRTPCLRCVDLARRDQDASWPLVAGQLASRANWATEEPLLAMTAGPLAASQLLGLIDGRPGSHDGLMLELTLPWALPRTRRWQPHPECGCHHLTISPE